VIAAPVTGIVSGSLVGAAAAMAMASFITRGEPSGATPWAMAVWAPAGMSDGMVTGLEKSPLASVTVVPSRIGELYSVITTVEYAANPVPMKTICWLGWAVVIMPLSVVIERSVSGALSDVAGISGVASLDVADAAESPSSVWATTVTV